MRYKDCNKLGYDCCRGLVVPNLGVDLNSIIETGTVPDTVSETLYNQITEVEHVGNRIDNPFQAMLLQRENLRRLSEIQKAEKKDKKDNDNDKKDDKKNR